MSAPGCRSDARQAGLGIQTATSRSPGVSHPWVARPPAIPAGSPDRHTLIIIAGINAAAVAAAPGSRSTAASAAEWSIARAAGEARPDRGRSAWEGPGQDR
jgi:hypothetical protein